MFHLQVYNTVVFFLGLFMRVLIPCLFSSPVFALFFSFPLNNTFVCCLPPSCAYLAFQILLPLIESHLPNAITLPSPFRLFSSSLVTLMDAALCLGYLTTQQLWGLTCRAVWSNLRRVNNSPLFIFQKTLNIPPAITRRSQIPFAAYNKTEIPFPFPRFLIFNKVMLLLSTKIVPKIFEFKGCDIWKLLYGKDSIFLNTLTSL